MQMSVSSPQPQPIDGIAGVRAAPWDDSAPRAVQVVFRRGALVLMPLLCRNRQERRCNPPFSTRMSMAKSCTASGKRSAASEAHSLCGCVPRGLRSRNPRDCTSRRAWSVTRASDQSSCVASKGATLQARSLITAGSPMELGLSRTHLD